MKNFIKNMSKEDKQKMMQEFMNSMSEEEKSEMMKMMMPLMMKDCDANDCKEMMAKMPLEMREKCRKMMTECLNAGEGTEESEK